MSLDPYDLLDPYNLLDLYVAGDRVYGSPEFSAPANFEPLIIRHFFAHQLDYEDIGIWLIFCYFINILLMHWSRPPQLYRFWYDSTPSPLVTVEHSV